MNAKNLGKRSSESEGEGLVLHLTKFWASATNCTDSRGIFAGGIVHLRLSMCLQKGATID